MAAPSRVIVLDADVRLVASTGEKTLGSGKMSRWSEPLKRGDESWGPPVPMPFVDGLRLLTEGGGGSCSRKGKAAAAEPKKGIVDWVLEGTIRVATDDLIRAPEISTLSVHFPAAPRDIVAQLPDLSVKSADKDLLVLYTGAWSYDYPSSGWYLVYDAVADALFLPPPMDCDFDWNTEIFGCCPVVMRYGQATCDFVLALVAMSMSTQQYYLLTWSPAFAFKDGKVQEQQWICKPVCLPDDVVKYPFTGDVAFAFDGRLACWVDLYLGLLTCDVLSEDPKFQLKHLPEDYVVYYGRFSHGGRPDAHSTMGCGVDGSIKFVYMDGFHDDFLPKDKITIKTWTLKGQVPDFCTWMRDNHTTLSCGDLWDDESFLAIPGLPKRPPIFPILSPNEPDVVYFFLSDTGYPNGTEHFLGLNLLTKKVHTWSKCPPGTLRLMPSFIATELSPSQESSNMDDQGNATHKSRKQKSRKSRK